MERPDYKNLCEKILKDFEPVIRRKVKKNFSFLYKNNNQENWFTQQDFQSELRTVAIKNIIKYSDETDPTFIRKAVMRKLNHEVVALLYRYTAKKRKCILRVSEAEKKKILVKVTDRDSNVCYRVVSQNFTEASYQTQLMSLDRNVFAGDSVETYHSKVSCTRPSFVKHKENKKLCAKNFGTTGMRTFAGLC